MAQERKPFDWEGFVNWLEKFFPAFLTLLRLFIGVKKMKQKIEQYEAHVQMMEQAKADAERYQNEQ